MHQAKTQISLGIHEARSESSVSAWRSFGSLTIHKAHNKDSDQTGRMPRLIWVFARRTVHLSQLMRLWYLLHRRPAKAQASLRIRAVSPQPSLFAHMKYRSRRRVRPNIRHLAPLDGCACTFEEWVSEDEKCHNLMRWLILFVLSSSNKPRHKKICLRGFRPSEAQTGLLSYRD